MALHQGHIARGHVTHGDIARWWAPGLRRAGAARRPRSATRPIRLSYRMAVAVVLETIILLGTVQLTIGLGFAGQAGALPGPAPAPGYVAAPAPAAGAPAAAAPAAAALEAPKAPEPVPAPLQPPPPVR